MATGGYDAPMDEEDDFAGRYTSVDDVGCDDFGRTDSLIEKELNKGGIFRLLGLNRNGNRYDYRLRKELYKIGEYETENSGCVDYGKEAFSTSQDVTGEESGDDMNTPEKDSSSQELNRGQRSTTNDPLQSLDDGASHKNTSEQVNRRISQKPNLNHSGGGKSYAVKHQTKSQTSSSLGSSVLPDIVSTSTSTSDSNSYSVVEDISNRHESSLRGESLVEMMAEYEEVFEGQDDRSRQYTGEEGYKTSRQFSSPEKLSEEKIRSLQNDVPLSRRLKSVPVKLSTSTEDTDNFTYVNTEKPLRKSISDLGSSLKSSREEQDQSAHEKRLVYRTTSHGYHTGESIENGSFEDTNNPVAKQQTPTKDREMGTSEADDSDKCPCRKTTENQSPNRSTQLENNQRSEDTSPDSSLEIDVNELDLHILKEKLFPGGITMVQQTLKPPTAPNLPHEALLAGAKSMDKFDEEHTIPMMVEHRQQQQNQYKQVDVEENPHDKFCKEILEKWNKSEKTGGHEREDELLDVEEKVSLRQLQIAKQCDYKFCEDEQCKLGKVLLSCIKICLGTLRLGAPERVALSAIKKHASVCSELYCTVPWCSDFLEIDTDDVQTAVDIFMNEHLYDLGGGNERLKLQRENMEKFTPLDEDQGYFSLPDSGLDIDVIKHFESSESVILAPDLQNRFKYMVVKKARCYDETWDTVVALRETQPYHQSHLVTHLWAAKLKFPRTIFIASQFEAWNLREIIQHRKRSRRDSPVVSHEEACRWLHSAMNALYFLHTHKILYLNWKAENLLVSVNPKDPSIQYLKLCNFNTSITKSAAQRNSEEVAEELAGRLAPHLVPVEFLGDQKDAFVKFPTSDYWPFGCLVYELVTGDPLNWEWRHESVEQQRKKIKKFMSGRRSFPKVTNGVKQLLQQCFERDPEKRRPDFSLLKKHL